MSDDTEDTLRKAEAVKTALSLGFKASDELQASAAKVIGDLITIIKSRDDDVNRRTV